MTAELQQIKTEAVTNLIEKNLYQQALILAEKHWGDHHHWQHRQQFLTGIELFNGLGLRRKTMACRFRLWRADKSDPYAIFHYVRAVLDRRGPLQALQVAKTFGELDGADTTLQAQWFALLGDIYGQYRDWDTAQNYLDKAISLDPTNPRVLMGQIYLDVDQDKYEAAWERNQSLMQRHHRPAIQYGAHLKTLQHDNTAAIDILQQHLFKIESIALALQLYRLYYEEGQLEQARACVERAASLLPAGDGSMSEGFSVAAYELAFKQDDIDAACTALSDVKSPFYKRIRENLSQRKPEDQQKILEVPFVRQHHMTCAPATLTALCRYWGTAVDHLGVVEEICYDGTPNHAERRWAEGQGWIAREFKLEPEIAFALIDRGVPFTLSTVAPQSAHLQAVVGYDQRRGIYLIRDPFYPSLQEFLIEQLGEQCRSSGPRCLAILPADKAHLLEGLEFPETELYDDYFRLIESQATMLGRHQGSDAAIEFLDSRLKLNEQDKALLFMKLDWLFERSLEEQQTFCKHIIEIHPSLYEGYLRLSRILMRQHQFDAACAAAETAYEINPYNVEVSLTLGDIYFQQEQVAKAHKIYRSTLEYSVDADGVFDRLLRCHETFEEKRKELSHILDQLMQQTSYGSGILEYKDVARNLVKDEELLSFLEKAVEIRPDLWQSGYALLSHLQTMDQLERALSYANQAIAKFPLLPRLYLGRANIHFVAQNFSDAESDLKEALKQNPHWETAIIRLMDVLEAQKRYDEALVLIQKSLKFAPTNSVFHGCAADLLVGEGNTEAAIEHLEKALELNPRYDWAWDRYRGLIQKTDRPTAAKDLAKSILKERPHSVTVWCKLAEFEEDLEQRLKYLDEALEHHPKDEDINLIKCRALFGLNRIAAVKELIHDAKWNDNLPVSLLAFEAWMEAKYQRYPEAIDLMEPLTQRFPHYYDAWRLLAEWHKTLERYEQAVKYVDTCVRLYPHSPQTLTLAAEIYLEAQHNDVDVSDEAIGGFLERRWCWRPRINTTA